MHINQISTKSLIQPTSPDEVLFVEIRESKYIFGIPQRLRINEQSKISFGYKRTSRVTEINVKAMLLLGEMNTLLRFNAPDTRYEQGGS